MMPAVPAFHTHYTPATFPVVADSAATPLPVTWNAGVSESPSPMTCSQQVALLGSIAPGWHLRDPLDVTLDYKYVGDTVQVIASEYCLNVYGVGATAYAALNELVSMLLDLYQELRNSEALLSTQLRRQLDYLNSILIRQ